MLTVNVPPALPPIDRRTHAARNAAAAPTDGELLRLASAFATAVRGASPAALTKLGGNVLVDLLDRLEAVGVAIPATNPASSATNSGDDWSGYSINAIMSSGGDHKRPRGTTYATYDPNEHLDALNARR